MNPNPFLQALLAESPSQALTTTYGYTSASPYSAFDPAMADVSPYDLASGTTDPIYQNMDNQIAALAQAIPAVLDEATPSLSAASLIGYLNRSACAMPRQVQNKLDEWISVMDAGAAGDGVTDDSNAFLSALQALTNAGGGTLRIPAGTYVLTQPLQLSPNTVLRGDGQNTTVLLFESPNIQAISFINTHGVVASNIEISDLTIASTQSGVMGIRFVQAYITSISRVNFFGLMRNLEIDRGSYHTIRQCYTSGYGSNPMGGFRIWSSTDSDYAYNVVMDNVLCAPTATGTLIYDPAQFYLRRVINSYFIHLNTTTLAAAGGGYQNGIMLENDCQGVQIGECVIVKPNYGLYVRQGNGIAVVPTYTTIRSFSVDQSFANSIVLVNCQYMQVIGGMMTPNASTISNNVVLIFSGATNITFDGMIIEGFSGPNGSGFWMNGGSYVTVQKCQIDSCNTAFIVTNNASHIRAFDNSLMGCTNALGGSISGTGNYFARNDGLNPSAISSPAIPASGIALTNTTGVRCTIYVTGGTVTGYAVNGQTIPGLSGAQKFEMQPGESITLTYSAAPSWTWIGH